jgi:hypothetical protein
VGRSRPGFLVARVGVVELDTCGWRCGSEDLALKRTGSGLDLCDGQVLFAAQRRS